MNLKRACAYGLVAIGLVVGLQAAAVVAASPAVTWTASVQPIPPNSNGDNLDLMGVSCTGASSCVAVGSYGINAYIDTLSGGTSTAIDAPFPAGLGRGNGYVDELDAISCPAPGVCVAVGDASNYSVGVFGVIDQLSGGTWSTLTSGSGVRWQSVSCADPTFCVAGAGNLAELDTFSGGTWTPTAAPIPANGSPGGLSEINGVSCPTIGSCVAVGEYSLSNGQLRGLIESYDNGAWTATEAPETATGAAAYAAYLHSVSCVSAASCTAVGALKGNGVYSQAGSLAETLTSGHWVPHLSRVNAENLLGNGNAATYPGLYSVSCWAAGDCAAVGGTSGALVTTMFAASSKNGTWKNAGFALPVNAVPTTTIGLVSVSCGAANFCVGVGGYVSKNPATAHALLVAFNGTGWSETRPALPLAGADNIYVGGVSCVGSGSGSCAAVGGILASRNGDTAIAITD